MVDEVRPDAAALIASLKAKGIAVELLSGDQSGAVAQLARQLGIDEFIAGAKPGDKLSHLNQRQAAGDKVLMIGDGINDIPVLSGADVSVAMASASDLAQTRADAVLLNDRLAVLSDALEIARRTKRVIGQNLRYSLVYNLLALPLAAAGMIPPWLAALGLTLALDPREAFPGTTDGVTDHAAVELDLGFTRTSAHADAAALPLQVRPAAHQPGRQVLQASEFHLQLAFMAAGALREDLQNEQGAVIDRQTQRALQVALLRRAQGLVKKNLAGALGLGEHLDLFGFAGPDEQGRIGCTALAADPIGHRETRGLGQQTELFQFGIKMRQTKIHPDQNDRWDGWVLGGGRVQIHSTAACAVANTAGFRGSVKRLALRPGRLRRIAPDDPARWWRWRACTPSGSRCCATAPRTGQKIQSDPEA